MKFTYNKTSKTQFKTTHNKSGNTTNHVGVAAVAVEAYVCPNHGPVATEDGLCPECGSEAGVELVVTKGLTNAQLDELEVKGE